MIWYILITVFFILLLWILLVPVILHTNTERNRYLLTLPGVFRAVVVPQEGLFRIKGWILFIPFSFDPFQKRKAKEPGKAREKKKRKWRIGNLRSMKGALSAFRIKRLKADIDTDDFTLNAWLVPAFSMINGEDIQLQVNFEGHSSLLLDLRVTLGALLWALIKSKIIYSMNH